MTRNIQVCVRECVCVCVCVCVCLCVFVCVGVVWVGCLGLAAISCNVYTVIKWMLWDMRIQMYVIIVRPE